MSTHVLDLTIAVGASRSNAIDRQLLKRATALTIWSPAVLAGTVTVMVSPKDATASVSGDYLVLQSSGADVEIPSSKATPLTTVAWGSMLLADSAPASGSDEVFPVNIQGDENLS